MLDVFLKNKEFSFAIFAAGDTTNLPYVKYARILVFSDMYFPV